MKKFIFIGAVALMAGLSDAATACTNPGIPMGAQCTKAALKKACCASPMKQDLCCRTGPSPNTQITFNCNSANAEWKKKNCGGGGPKTTPGNPTKSNGPTKTVKVTPCLQKAGSLMCEAFFQKVCEGNDSQCTIDSQNSNTQTLNEMCNNNSCDTIFICNYLERTVNIAECIAHDKPANTGISDSDDALIDIHILDDLGI